METLFDSGAFVALTTMRVRLPNLTTHQTFVERLSVPAILPSA